jgi:hypothetical protein
MGGDGPMVWPAWVYCTRYSDRPSSGEYTHSYIHSNIVFICFYSELYSTMDQQKYKSN